VGAARARGTRKKKMKNKYYREGYTAYKVWGAEAGTDFHTTPLPRCPYIEGSEQFNDWCRGYNNARGK